MIEHALITAPYVEAEREMEVRDGRAKGEMDLTINVHFVDLCVCVFGFQSVGVPKLDGDWPIICSSQTGRLRADIALVI